MLTRIVVPVISLFVVALLLIALIGYYWAAAVGVVFAGLAFWLWRRLKNDTSDGDLGLGLVMWLAAGQSAAIFVCLLAAWLLPHVKWG